MSKVNLIDLTSSKIENTSFPLNIVLTHTHLTNTKLRIFFKGDNHSFALTQLSVHIIVAQKEGQASLPVLLNAADLTEGDCVDGARGHGVLAC